MPANNNIYIKSVDTTFIKEQLAAGTITPGNFVKRDANNKFVRQDTASVRNANLIALEADPIGGDLNDDYSAGDTVRAAFCQPGDVVLTTLAAGADAIALGDRVEFDGEGNVQILGTDNYPMGMALEAVDNSGGAAVVRIKIEIL